MAELDDPLGPAEVAQMVTAQRKQRRAGWQMVCDDLFGRTRQHGLAAVGEVAQACRSVDRRSDVVAFVTQLDLAGVQTDPQPDRRERCQLQVEGARHRVTAAVERDNKTVPFALFHGPHAVVRGNDVHECAVEPCDGFRHLVRLRFPQPRRAFDVGQQQGHRAGR